MKYPVYLHHEAGSATRTRGWRSGGVTKLEPLKTHRGAKIKRTKGLRKSIVDTCKIGSDPFVLTFHKLKKYCSSQMDTLFL